MNCGVLFSPYSVDMAVNTLGLVMLACVEVFKRVCATTAALVCAPLSPTEETNEGNRKKEG